MEKLKHQMDACEITGLTAVQSGLRLHLHHVILRSQGGDDVEENILCVTGDLHESYHRSSRMARHSIAMHVWSNRPDVWAYLGRKLGASGREEWFRSHTYD